MQLHPFILGIAVARCALLLISTPPFQTSGAWKYAPKIIICILYMVMIPYEKCLVNSFSFSMSLRSRLPSTILS